MEGFIYTILQRAQALSSKITNSPSSTTINGEIESLAWDLENAIRNVTHTLGVLPEEVEKEYAAKLKLDARFAEFRRCVDYIVNDRDSIDKIGWIRGLLNCDDAVADIIKKLDEANERAAKAEAQCSALIEDNNRLRESLAATDTTSVVDQHKKNKSPYNCKHTAKYHLRTIEDRDMDGWEVKKEVYWCEDCGTEITE